VSVLGETCEEISTGFCLSGNGARRFSRQPVVSRAGTTRRNQARIKGLTTSLLIGTGFSLCVLRGCWKGRDTRWQVWARSTVAFN